MLSTHFCPEAATGLGFRIIAPHKQRSCIAHSRSVRRYPHHVAKQAGAWRRVRSRGPRWSYLRAGLRPRTYPVQARYRRTAAAVRAGRNPGRTVKLDVHVHPKFVSPVEIAMIIVKRSLHLAALLAVFIGCGGTAPEIGRASCRERV